MAKTPIPTLIKNLEKVFNRFIRLRDTEDGWGNCISCGANKPFEKLDAGHYWTVKDSATRFDERNVNAQCISCNRYRPDYAKPFYAEALKEKYGDDILDELNSKRREVFKWKRDWLEEKIEYYKNKVKELDN